jgi:glycerophosphoryl diester phosphodiesterase
MWPYPRIIAHRGGGSLAPENTLEAFQRGFNCGFRAVEFDVMLTKDQIPVVVHDEQLGRTVGGNGKICELTAVELVQLDAGSWYGSDYAGARVPTLTQVLDFCTRHAIWMNIEIKPAAGFDENTGRIVAEVTRDFYQNTNFIEPLFSSFSMDALAAAQRSAPHIARGTLFDQIPADWLVQVKQLNAVSLHTNQRTLSADMADKIKQAGLGLCCYTVNDPLRARELLAMGVDALFTDNLKIIGADFV